MRMWTVPTAAEIIARRSTPATTPATTTTGNGALGIVHGCARVLRGITGSNAGKIDALL